MGNYAPYPDRQQTENHLQADIGERGSILCVASQRKCFESKRGEGCEAAENANE